VFDVYRLQGFGLSTKIRFVIFIGLRDKLSNWCVLCGMRVKKSFFLTGAHIVFVLTKIDARYINSFVIPLILLCVNIMCLRSMIYISGGV
jgi:hypothetical protein